MLDLSKEPLPFTCPSCGKEFSLTFEEAQRNTVVTCPKCGLEFELGLNSGAKQKITSGNKSVKDFEKQLKKLNKSMKF